MQLGLGLSLTHPAVLAGLRPTLDYVFAGASVLPSGLTFTRASTGTRFNSAGTLVTEAVDQPRFDHDPGNANAALGILSESARTNVGLHAEAFDNAAWSKRGTAAVTANDTTAPDGALTADKLAGIGTTAGSDDIFNTITGLAVSAAYSPSLFIKRISTSGVLLLNNTQTGTLGSWRINLSLLGNGWERITQSHPAVTVDNAMITDGSGRCGIHLRASSGAPLSFHAWGAQVEIGAAATAYIPTASATASRSGETRTSSANGVFGASSGTIVINARTARGSGTQVLWQADDGTANNRITVSRNASNQIVADLVSGGVSQASLTLGTVANNTAFKVGLAWATNDVAGVLNGGAAVTDTTATIPTGLTTIRGGHDLSGNRWNATTARERAYSTRLSVAQLQSLTA